MEYPPEAWAKQIHLARILQHSDPTVVAHALQTFVDRYEEREPDEDTKPLLLLRVVFEYPGSVPRSNGMFAFNRFWDGLSDLNKSARVNLGWPVSWQGGHPHLVARFSGSEGASYAVAGEYRYALKHFRLRSLSPGVAPREIHSGRPSGRAISGSVPASGLTRRCTGRTLRDCQGSRRRSGTMQCPPVSLVVGPQVARLHLFRGSRYRMAGAMDTFSPPLQDDEQFWCALCERVSPRRKEGCTYPDCETDAERPENREAFERRLVAVAGPDYEAKVRQGYSIRWRSGGLWSGLRESHHPEYPRVARPGVRYPMPEFAPRFRVEAPRS